MNKAACALTKKVIAKGHFVVAIVVRVIYSILLIFLALYISNLLPKRETRSAQESRDNNEHMAFLDIGCECGVMKYAFFTL